MPRLTTKQKTDVMTQLAAGTSTASELAAKYSVDKSAISHLAKRHRTTINSLNKQVASEQIDIQRRILNKGLLLIEKKLDILNKNKRQLEATQLSQLSSMISDIWKQIQVEEGKPTEITQSHKNINEVRQFLLQSVNNISHYSPLDILEN